MRPHYLYKLEDEKLLYVVPRKSSNRPTFKISAGSGQGKVAFPRISYQSKQANTPNENLFWLYRLIKRMAKIMPPETSLKYLTTAISQGRLVSFPWPSEEKGRLLGAFTKWSIGHHYHKWSCLLRFASGRQNFSQLGSYGHSD